MNQKDIADIKIQIITKFRIFNICKIAVLKTSESVKLTTLKCKILNRSLNPEKTPNSYLLAGKPKGIVPLSFINDHSI